MPTQKPQSYELQMKVLEQMLKAQEDQERRVSSADDNSRLMHAVGSFADTVSATPQTATEMRAGVMPQQNTANLGSMFRGQGAMAAEKARNDYANILRRYDGAREKASLMRGLESSDAAKSAQENEFAQKLMLENMKHQNALALQKLKKPVGGAGSSALTSTLTKGDEAVDRDFAKEYVDWKAKGGFADVKKQLDQLNDVASQLEQTDMASGPFVGSQPKFLRSITNPKSVEMQEAVEEVVQRNLRLILGAQFTEKEGTRLIERAYNPMLSEKENAKRIRRLIDQISEAAKAKQEAADYYAQNGTLKGFKGDVYTSASQFLADYKAPKARDDKKSVGTSYAEPKKLPTIEDVDAMSEAEIDAMLKEMR